jgi:hypothetical protein
MVRTCENSSELGLELDLNRCNGLYHTKSRTIANGPVIPPQTRHFNITALPPIRYLSSDCIVTWSVSTLCSSSRSFTPHFLIWDPTNIGSVAIANPQISHKMCLYFTATQRISVGSQIWQQKVKERLELHNLHTDHIMIQLELKYLIRAKVAKTIKRNRGQGTTQPKNCGFMSCLGDKPAKTNRVRFLAGFGT